MIVRTKKNKNYTTINNTVLRDERLSWRARGIAAYLLTMPDDWEISHDHLWKHGVEGRDAVLNAMRELEDAGYLVRTKFQDKKGKFQTVVVLHEEPQPSPENQVSVNQDSVNQVSVNQDSRINTKDEILKTNNDDGDDRVRERGDVIKAYHENISIITPMIGEQLNALMDEIGHLSVLAGIRAAAESKVLTYRYVQSCARNHANGVGKPERRQKGGDYAPQHRTTNRGRKAVEDYIERKRVSHE
jgi:hypothetical protein